MRIIFGLGLLILAAQMSLALHMSLAPVAQAQSLPQNQATEPEPEPEPDQVCGGLYVRAAEVLDGAFRDYETLYAGGYGYRGSGGEDLQYTLNSYRMFSGLEPYENVRWSQKAYRPLPYDFEKRSRLALKFMWTWDMDYPYSPVDVTTVLNGLNSAHRAASGPNPDHNGNTDRPRYTSLTNSPSLNSERAQTYARLFEEHEELQWLQAALDISIERHLWRTGGDYPTAKFETALQTIEDKAASIKQLNPWFALLSEHRFFNRPIPVELQGHIIQAIERVSNCEGTEREYAILVAGDLGLPDRFIPANILQQRLVKEARFLTVTHGVQSGLDGAYHAQIQALADRAADPSLFALPLMLSAPDIEAIEAGFKLSPNSHRALAILPARSLETIAPKAAFARYLALGETQNASRALSLMEDVDGSDIGSDNIDIAALPAASPAALPESVQLTLTALRMECLSLFVGADRGRRLYRRDYHCHHNLPSYYQSLGFVETELSEWLYPTFEYLKNLKSYYRQYGGDFMNDLRYYKRHSGRLSEKCGESCNPYQLEYSAQDIGIVPNILSPETGQLGIFGLADMAEFDRVTGDENLIRTLSLNIIRWIQEASPSERALYGDLMAEALHRIVRLSKHESGGVIDGMQAGQKAFALLHRYFPKSQWTDKTPYWFKTRDEHG